MLEMNKQIYQEYQDKCDAMLKKLDAGGKPKEARQLIDAIIQIFQSEIGNIEAGISGYGLYSSIDESACKKELEILRGKLYLIGSRKDSKAGGPADISALFEVTRKSINENDSLSAAETEEVLSRIDALEEIQNKGAGKKQKWEMLRGDLEWLSTKGAAVAVPVLNIIWEMMNEPL